jgi:hypothetical protein
VVPDEPGLHLLQKQGRLARRQVSWLDGVIGLRGLVLNFLDEVKRPCAAGAAVAHTVGEWDLHEDQPSHGRNWRFG